MTDCTTMASNLPSASLDITLCTAKLLSAAPLTPYCLSPASVIFSLTLNTTRLASLMRRSPSITRVLASITRRVSPKSIGASPSALMTMLSPLRRSVPRV